MESSEPEEKFSNTKTGEETLALEKKRSKSRRVSFAETTAIHLFIRDEEYETPPEVEGLSNGRLHRSESDEIRDLLASDSDESGGDDDGTDGNAVKRSFLLPMESPSPGSYFGSATSNDEDNFFGPVSAEFIKPGRLSDSAASDENQDVTMDSTAFSMHFRSLAKSDSGGEFKTPTGVRLEFGERTSGQVSTTTSGGDAMVLTTSRKRVAGSSLLADTINRSGNSDDMSVVGENPRKYDYGELPPELDVLLAEDDKIVGAVSLTSNAEYSNTIASGGSALHENGLDADAHPVSDMVKTSNGAISAVHVVRHDTLGDTTRVTSDMDDDQFPLILSDDTTKTPTLLTNVMSVDKDEAASKGSVEADGKFLSSPLNLQPNLSHEQPIAGSVSSYLGVHWQTSRGSPYVKSNLFDSKKNFSDKETKHILSASSYEKGISRLKRLEAVRFSSVSKVEGNSSRLMPPESLTSSLTRSGPLKYGSKGTPNNIPAAPVVCLDKHFTEVVEDAGRSQSKGKVGSYNRRSLGDAKYVIHTGVKDAEMSYPSEVVYPHKSIKFTGTGISPLALSKDKRMEPCRSRDSHMKEPVLSTASDQAFTPSKHNRETGMPVGSTSSPENSAERKVSASPLYQGSLSKNPNLQAESSLSLCPDVEQRLADKFASRFECTSSLHTERKEKALWSTSNMEHSKFVNQEMQDNGSMLKKLDKACESFKHSSVDVDTGAMSTTTLPVKNMNFAGFAPTSEDDQYEVSIQVYESPKEDLSCGRLQKKPLVTDNVNAHCFAGNTVLTPRSYQLSGKHDQNDRCVVKPSNISASSSSLKRKLFDKADDHDDESASFQHRPKLCKDQKNCVGDSKVPHGIGGDTTERNWIEVFSSFCHKIKLLSSSLIDKLDLPQVRMLNDIMVHLDKMRSYELLHHGISYQKSFDSASYHETKRLVDTKLLLYRTVYQKARLLLMRLERDKLLNQVSQLDSRVEKSKMLKTSCLDSCLPGLKDATIDCFSPIDPSKRNLVAVEIPSMRKELEVSDRHIRNLNNSFNVHIKVPKELTCSETTVHVKNFLRKRVACRSVQSECQLCQVGNVEVMDGKPSVRFDHGGIMSQRFIVKSISTYSLMISNTLNNVKISKMFPGMDACTAFSFASHGQSNLAYFGFSTIAQETQRTTSLFHSVLDVVEEVELATLELRNLTYSSFSQLAAGKLDLRLCFTDFNCGATVSLSIDITCLDRGIYPSQVLPYEVQGKSASRHESFQSLLDSIKNAVRGVRCGYMRIISLCRCVSKTIQASYMS